MRSRVAILTITAVLPLTAVTSLMAANQAAADPRSGEVVVTGSVEDCENGAAPAQVRIVTSAETRTDINQGVSRANLYSVTFQNIAKDAGTKATVTVTCTNDSYTEGVRIVRPPSGDLVQKLDLAP
jgi:hypothetical protein